MPFETFLMIWPYQTNNEICCVIQRVYIFSLSFWRGETILLVQHVLISSGAWRGWHKCSVRMSRDMFVEQPVRFKSLRNLHVCWKCLNPRTARTWLSILDHQTHRLFLCNLAPNWSASESYSWCAITFLWVIIMTLFVPFQTRIILYCCRKNQSNDWLPQQTQEPQFGQG